MVWLLAALPVPAAADCTLVEALTRFQSAPVALAAPPASRDDAAARQQLEAEMLRVDGDSVRFALRAHDRATDVAALADFADLSAELARLSRAGQHASVQSFASMPASRRTIAAARAALPRFGCDTIRVSGPGGADGRDADRSAPRPSEAPSQAESSDINLVVTIPLLLGIVLLAAAALTLYVRREDERRRQARRFSVSRPIRFRIGSTTLGGTLIDISCLGAKLQHGGQVDPSATGPVTIRLAGRWHRADPSWGNAHYLGVRFQTRLTLPQLLQILATPPRADAGQDRPETKNGARKAPIS